MRRKKMKAISAMLIAMFMSTASCSVQLSNLKSGYVLPPDSSESVVVLGVNQRVRLGFSDGETVNGQWNCGKGSLLTANLWPKDGYIVLKLKPTQGNGNYGISQLLLKGQGPHFTTMKGIGVMNFQVPPGKVLYLGNIELEVWSRLLNAKITSDMKSARKFMEANYPKLSEHLIKGEIVTTIAARGC